MSQRLTAGPTLGDVVTYVSAGWRIVLLRGKVPAIAGGHGVLDATDDLELLRTQWKPGYNIGARVPEGVVVVDVDPRHGGTRSLASLTRRHGPLPITLTCYSGRGDGGRHFYFGHRGEVSTRRLREIAPGVDVKTSRGYIVLPPSLHPATRKPYRWAAVDSPIAECPAWLVEILRPPEPVDRPAIPQGSDSRQLARYVAVALEAEVSKVRTCPIGAGLRNTTLYGAAVALGTLVGAGVLDASRAAQELLTATTLPESEARATILSGLKWGADHPRQVAS